MLTNIHPALGVNDAIAQLDSHIPLLHVERELIVQTLWDLAFNTGAKQGRLAGVEAVQNRLREIADAASDHQIRSLLRDIADSYDSPHAEYKDPGTVLREKLAGKIRQRDGG